MLKIAAAQSIVSADIRANGKTICGLIQEAAREGVRLINFCEGALSGYPKAQIASPEDWEKLDWTHLEQELDEISDCCKTHRIFAVVGSAYPLLSARAPLNSQLIFSDNGELIGRYDKRYLSNSELKGWFTPGKDALTFEVDEFRFGCLTCIEVQFPELFMEYERENVDAILFSSYGISNFFQIALRAHAGFNCLWISGATPAQTANEGPAGIIGPNGKIVSHCATQQVNALATTTLDRNDPAFHEALHLARPWRRKARAGAIYNISEAR